MSFEQADALGQRGEPFLLISDFLAKRVEVYPLDTLDAEDIEFSIAQEAIGVGAPLRVEKKPLSLALYQEKFDTIIEAIKRGDTYLLNLTQPTKVRVDASLKEIYRRADAKYKLRYKEEFVCFSPETFVQIENAKIHTFPMKGTIDATLPHAKERILHDPKELSEHVMVVDLLRNDLGIVAKEIRVESFRNVEKIHAGTRELLQVSSHISGQLEESWHERIGTILKQLLPAGSISGTPKKRTVEIIQEVEGYERGFFSGIFGVYDGKRFDSGVMIRFLEMQEDGFVYKSGGGITLDSQLQKEYQELLDKVYLR